MSRYPAFVLFLVIVAGVFCAAGTIDDSDQFYPSETISTDPSTLTSKASTESVSTAAPTTASTPAPAPTTASTPAPAPTTASTPAPALTTASTPAPALTTASTPAAAETNASTPATAATTLPPTTAAAPTTTTTNAPNVTSTAPNTTTTVPTPTTTPAPPPNPTSHLYKVMKGNDSCLLVKFGIRIGFHGMNKYEEMNFEFSNKTVVSGSCEEDNSTLSIQDEALTLLLTFHNDTKKSSLRVLSATGKFESGTTFSGSNNTLALWQATLGNSYMCNKEQNNTITDKLSIFTFELQVQPFGVKKDSFSTAEDCMADGESFIVPIAVGVALLVLILIVVVAYFIGRKRNMASAEECFLDSDLSFLVPIAVGVALSFLIILVLISYLIGRRKSRTGYQSV